MHDSGPLALEILRQANRLKMSIAGQAEIASTLKHYSQCFFSAQEIDALCREVTFFLNKARKEDSAAEALIRSLAKTGQLLWEHLFTPPVKEKLKSAATSNLILLIDEELVSIPWELLHDGDNFLCLKFNLSRLVRTKKEPAPTRFRSILPQARMLILANPTHDLKSAYHEGINIRNQFERKKNSPCIDFKSTCINKLFVQKNLSDYDIVHFAGHCEYDPDHQKNTGWVLSDGRFTAQDILALGSTGAMPSLVFSHACHSASSSGLLDTDYQQRYYSLAAAFLFSGVRHYIGSIRRIEDTAGLCFAKEFYAQLIAGKCVGECVRLGRIKLAREYGWHCLHWANYLLYGDPNFILFGPPVKARGPKAKKAIAIGKKQVTALALVAAIIPLFIYLYTVLPSLNPGRYRDFQRCEKFFREGNNRQAVSLCSALIKKDPQFLGAYPLLAKSYERQGARHEALKIYFDYALQSQKRQDINHLTAAYTQIGWAYYTQNDFSKAVDFYKRAIALSVETKNKLNQAIAMRKLALVYIDQENYDLALQLLTKSSAINRERQGDARHRYNLGCDYFDIGLLFTDKDDLPAAQEFYGKSLKIFQGLKLKSELSDYYFNAGEIYKFEKQYQKALECYARGLEIDRQAGNLPGLAVGLEMLGELYAEMGDFSRAREYFEQSAAMARRINCLPELASVTYNLGNLYRQAGQAREAKAYLQEALGLYKKIGSPQYQKVQRELEEK
ncbi:MAG: CHAT domain-containing protein [Candidatus Omnitrophota bacterium]|nr:CHAT domain-containing protein [Candidatus Omnitrophota bacterium]